MKLRDKNPERAALIALLNKKTTSKKSIWRSIAHELNRSQRGSREVNLFRIAKHAPEKGIVVVPGAVLGSGDITKPVTVAALKFTGTARKKITAVGGTCLSLRELVEKERVAEMKILG